MLRVHSLGVTDLVALMAAHRHDARSASNLRANRVSAICNDDNEITGEERADRHLIGPQHNLHSWPSDRKILPR
jgi:hypothetical protein